MVYDAPRERIVRRVSSHTWFHAWWGSIYVVSIHAALDVARVTFAPSGSGGCTAATRDVGHQRWKRSHVVSSRFPPSLGTRGWTLTYAMRMDGGDRAGATFLVSSLETDVKQASCHGRVDATKDGDDADDEGTRVHSTLVSSLIFSSFRLRWGCARVCAAHASVGRVSTVRLARWYDGPCYVIRRYLPLCDWDTGGMEVCLCLCLWWVWNRTPPTDTWCGYAGEGIYLSRMPFRFTPTPPLSPRMGGDTWRWDGMRQAKQGIPPFPSGWSGRRPSDGIFCNHPPPSLPPPRTVPVRSGREGKERSIWMDVGRCPSFPATWITR